MRHSHFYLIQNAHRKFQFDIECVIIEIICDVFKYLHTFEKWLITKKMYLTQHGLAYVVLDYCLCEHLEMDFASQIPRMKPEGCKTIAAKKLFLKGRES